MSNTTTAPLQSILKKHTSIVSGLSTANQRASQQSASSDGSNAAGKSRLSDLMQSIAAIDFNDAPPLSPGENRSSSIYSNHRLSAVSEQRSSQIHNYVLSILSDTSPPMDAITLYSIQIKSPDLLSATLYKLNGNSNTQNDWKPRYFLFDPIESNLYLFKLNPYPQSQPVTFLPVTSCSGFLDAGEDGKPILQVSGHGVVLRTWSLKVDDKGVFALWLKTIQRAVLEKQSSQYLGPPLSNSGDGVDLGRRSISIRSGQSQSRRSYASSIDMTRSTSLDGGSRSYGATITSNSMYQEYVAMYRNQPPRSASAQPAQQQYERRQSQQTSQNDNPTIVKKLSASAIKFFKR